MTADEIAAALRTELANAGALREIRMFGGVCVMLDGKMVAGTFRDNLLVRVGKQGTAAALAFRGAHEMEMKGRVMAGYVLVPGAHLTKAGLRRLLGLAVAFVGTLSKKPERETKKRRR